MFASVVAFQDPHQFESAAHAGGEVASEIIRQLLESENGGILIASFCLAMSIAFAPSSTTTEEEEELMTGNQPSEPPTAFITNSKNGSMFGLPI